MQSEDACYMKLTVYVLLLEHHLHKHHFSIIHIQNQVKERIKKADADEVSVQHKCNLKVF